MVSDVSLAPLWTESSCGLVRTSVGVSRNAEEVREGREFVVAASFEGGVVRR